MKRRRKEKREIARGKKSDSNQILKEEQKVKSQKNHEKPTFLYDILSCMQPCPSVHTPNSPLYFCEISSVNFFFDIALDSTGHLRIVWWWCNII